MRERRTGHRGRARAAATGRQAQKSANTQLQIVNAAIDCMIKYGYANTTTPKIAEEAGVSRGAMMHHFRDRLDVIRAAIQHLHNKRLKAFKRAARNVPDGADRLHELTQAYWRHVNHPLFTAFHELAVAARTDPDLRSILEPAQREFYQQWVHQAELLFPDWLEDRERFELALNVVQTFLEGLAFNLQFRPPKEVTERLLAYVEEQLRELAPPGVRARTEAAPDADSVRSVKGAS